MSGDTGTGKKQEDKPENHRNKRCTRMFLQGQPTCYYYNYIATDTKNIAAEVVNYMKYDAGAFGNHDIETGHAVYDKWIKEVECPIVGANIIDTVSGKPYTTPYTIILREGIKIAILGMTTPAIPNWLNESLWAGLRVCTVLDGTLEED